MGLIRIYKVYGIEWDYFLKWVCREEKFKYYVLEWGLRIDGWVWFIVGLDKGSFSRGGKVYWRGELRMGWEDKRVMNMDYFIVGNKEVGEWEMVICFVIKF